MIEGGTRTRCFGDGFGDAAAILIEVSAARVQEQEVFFFWDETGRRLVTHSSASF